MDLASSLERIGQRFTDGDTRDAATMLSHLVGELQSQPARVREEASTAIVSRVGPATPPAGAYFALAAGALIENGADPRALAGAILGPPVPAPRAAAPALH